MNEINLKKPALYTSSSLNEKLPSLFVGKCICGHTYFPPHLFGCEACGASIKSLTISEIPAKGRLKAYAAAHQCAGKNGKAPLYIGEIILENGPALQASLDISNESELEDTDVVVGQLVEIGINKSGEKIFDLFFVPFGENK